MRNRTLIGEGYMKTIILHFVSVLCVSLLLWQVTHAQDQLPTLKIVEYKDVKPFRGPGGMVNQEIVFELSNTTTKDITILGYLIENEFSQDQWTINKKTGEFEYADDKKPVLFDGEYGQVTASKTLKPGESFVYSLFNHVDTERKCDEYLLTGKHVLIGESRTLTQIIASGGVIYFCKTRKTKTSP